MLAGWLWEVRVGNESGKMLKILVWVTGSFLPGQLARGKSALERGIIIAFSLGRAYIEVLIEYQVKLSSIDICI